MISSISPRITRTSIKNNPHGALPLFIGGGDHVVVRGCKDKVFCLLFFFSCQQITQIQLFPCGAPTCLHVSQVSRGKTVLSV